MGVVLSYVVMDSCLNFPDKCEDPFSLSSKDFLFVKRIEFTK